MLPIYVYFCRDHLKTAHEVLVEDQADHNNNNSQGEKFRILFNGACYWGDG